jgi:hypothetical protein
MATCREGEGGDGEDGQVERGSKDEGGGGGVGGLRVVFTGVPSLVTNIPVHILSRFSSVYSAYTDDR